MKYSKIIGLTIVSSTALLTACTDDLANIFNSEHEIVFEVKTTSANDTRATDSIPEIEPVKLTADNGETYYLHTDITPMPESIQPADTSVAVTRGATADATSLHDGFGVTAYNTDGTTEGSSYFLNSSTSCTTVSTTDVYTPTGAGSGKYWPKGKLNFYAYYPYTSAVTGTHSQDTHGLSRSADGKTIKYVVPSTPANQPDLMTAKLENQQYSSGDGRAALTFNHALCAISFKTGTDIAGGTINSITFNNVYTEGKYDISTGTWSDTSAGNLSFTGLDVTTSFCVGETPILTDNNTLMVIPQDFEDDEDATITINISVMGVTHILSYSLKDTKWEKGKKVIYTITTHQLTAYYVEYAKKNPLWYVSEYNVNYDGNSNYSWASTSEDGYFFSWEDALTASDNISGWHLPTQEELWSIVPGDNTDIYSYVNGENKTAFKEFGSSQKAKWPYNTTTKVGLQESSFFVYGGDNCLYAVRFLGTEYCSIWKWERTGAFTTSDYGYLTITSRMIGAGTTVSNVSENYGTAEKCEEAFNALQFSNGEDIAHSASQRVFSARGYNNDVGSSSEANIYQGEGGCIWAAKQNINNLNQCVRIRYNSELVQVDYLGKNVGNPLRLWRGDCESHPIIVSRLKYGDVIYDDGTYTKLNEPVNTNDRTAVGVVMYVSSGNAYSEKGIVSKTGYTIDGKVLVVALHDANATRDIWGGNVDHTDGKISGYGSYVMFPNVNNSWTSADYSGYYKTKYLATSGCHSNHKLARYAWNYAPSSRTDYLALSSGWFLPSLPQWKQVAISLATNGDAIGENKGSSTISGLLLGGGEIRSNFLSLQNRAGGDESGTQQYGTSSESSATYSQHFIIESQYTAISSNTKLREDRATGVVGIDFARAFLAY